MTNQDSAQNSAKYPMKYKVGKVSEFQDGTKKRVVVVIKDPKNPEGRSEAIMVCLIKEKFYATSDLCTHATASLTAGKLCDYEIECGRHGAKFDVRTGEVKALPAAIAIKVYKVMVEEGEIFIEI